MVAETFNPVEFISTLKDNSEGALKDAAQYLVAHPDCLSDEGKKDLLTKVSCGYGSDSFHVNGRGLELADGQEYYKEYTVEGKSFLTLHTYSSWGDCYYLNNFGEAEEKIVELKVVSIKK